MVRRIHHIRGSYPEASSIMVAHVPGVHALGSLWRCIRCRPVGLDRPDMSLESRVATRTGASSTLVSATQRDGQP